MPPRWNRRAFRLRRASLPPRHQCVNGWNGAHIMRRHRRVNLSRPNYAMALPLRIGLNDPDRMPNFARPYHKPPRPPA